ncbi:MAG: hypothetical protein KGL17_07895, partial [Betaproteobacteria bacterium]|nr:hypothetical protein [Betaproteobacteria bacterium]
MTLPISSFQLTVAGISTVICGGNSWAACWAVAASVAARPLDVVAVWAAAEAAVSAVDAKVAADFAAPGSVACC